MDLFTNPLEKNIVRNKDKEVVVREYQTVYKPLRELSLGTDLNNLKINSSHTAFELIEKVWSKDILISESFYVFALNNYNRIIGYICISKGGMTGTVVDNRLLFNFLLSFPATACILAHNHPSGSPYPSEADKRLTKEVVASAKLLNINILDHLILYPRHTDDRLNYYSFADETML